ncbi:endonuclease domain-containing protein [Leifsonia sp. NPDC058292]|uniref:endonuclease domain-containing protein n=1 Tax=Leifsonia sp. NPDC058292 TaxID=3346428 RepID=UPI0036D93E69
MRRAREVPAVLSTSGFTTGAGRAAGMSKERMRGRDLARPFHGVRSTGHDAGAVSALCQAYASRMHPRGFFSHTTAAVVWGIPIPRRLESAADLHVSVPSPLRAPSGRGIVGHSATVRQSAVRLRDGVRVSAPERTWCELGAMLSMEDLVAAGDHIIHHGRRLASHEALRLSAAAWAGQRGVANLRSAVDLLGEHSESPPESRLRLMLLRAGFDDLRANAPIVLPDGTRYRADFAIPSRALLIEYQGDHHRDRLQYQRDLTRTAALQADGWTVLQLGHRDLLSETALIARIRAIILAHSPIDMRRSGVFDT